MNFPHHLQYLIQQGLAVTDVCCGNDIVGIFSSESHAQITLSKDRAQHKAVLWLNGLATTFMSLSLFDL